MTKKLSPPEKDWYFDVIEVLGGGAVTADRSKDLITYNASIKSDESHVRSATAEELVHAVIIGLLNSTEYGYKLPVLGHELRYAHGSKGSKSDEVDVLIKDTDGLPYAVFEIKAASEFEKEKDDAIENQLFGTAHLVGAPKLLVYATVVPKGPHPKIRAICIDYSKHKTFEAWIKEGQPSSSNFPSDYQDIGYEPYVNQGKNDLALDSTQADFRAIAAAFHNEFFGEHADNTIFVNLVKCLLAKIYDERIRKNGEPYGFQVFYRNGRPDTAKKVFEIINNLYRAAYKRYIDSRATEIDDINPKEFSEERVKTVVLALQGISITKGAARHGDIIGTFFEEILRAGFKQDRGMYFTHDNIVRFMVEVVDLAALTQVAWQKSNHPENRLPYVMDPACGSGSFLLHAMNTITRTVKMSRKTLVADHDSEQFYNARMSDAQPNYWAENFIYGFDPKFIMAITAKVNMVLHGDGSAHIFKDDAFRPFSEYADMRLRPCSESQRSVPRAQYSYDLCESFDVVLSNPPFGTTISSEVRNSLAKTFSLPESTPSEGLFLERCFQLLKPRGRLAIVLPESLLNAKEMSTVRLFLYRFFNIRAIVSMPRNIFIDTPTLTSLLFAQKKTAKEMLDWEQAWQAAVGVAEKHIKEAAQALRKKGNVTTETGAAIANEFLTAIKPVVAEKAWVLKSGKTPSVLRMSGDWSKTKAEAAADYYREILKTAGFQDLRQNYVFQSVVSKLGYDFPVFVVEEIGYKLSKRKEKARPNQLCVFRGLSSKREITNLHHMDEEYEVVVDVGNPRTTLDLVRKHIRWSQP